MFVCEEVCAVLRSTEIQIVQSRVVAVMTHVDACFVGAVFATGRRWSVFVEVVVAAGEVEIGREGFGVRCGGGRRRGEDDDEDGDADE